MRDKRPVEKSSALAGNTDGMAKHRVVLLVRPSRGFSRGLLRGIAKYAAQHGPWRFYRRKHAYLAPRNELDLDALRAWEPDGVVGPAEQVEQLVRLNVPLLTYSIDAFPDPVPCVHAEDTVAGELAARHLVGLGLRNFAFCGYDALRWSDERCWAFKAHLEQAGFPLHGHQLRGRIASTSEQELEEAGVTEWLDSLPKPVGVFCANDDLAEIVLETCHTQGYCVPDDIALLGADDDQYICELHSPPLSSVRFTAERAGYEGAALLERLMCGSESMAGQHIVARAAGVTVRQSTNVLKVGDPEVRKALRFIQNNSERPIQVADVVRATNLSRRALSDRFREECGCTMVERLTRARIDTISRLLAETNLRIHEIAEQVGYEDERHLARYFKRATGLTPRDYRERYSVLR